ncbi:MAG: LysM peptidoglycan-binding domain-containing protein, partial [Muribaculaceae bacterium]|nr:LysM peptidoglycan-binding domain-containing protein [Muribaculaceae bacterium]
THTVRKGDTLWKISQKYGTTVDKILKANGLNKNAKLQIGQKIKIPKR